MGNERLEKAKAARERHSAIDEVFRNIITRASLSRSDMVKMCERLPDFAEEHMTYLTTAPWPDYMSFFGDIMSLYMWTSAGKQFECPCWYRIVKHLPWLKPRKQ